MTLQIDPVRAALIPLDYQNYNVHPDGYSASTRILPVMGEVVKAADFIQWANAG